jgi:DNA-binding NtrC family response regulator
VAQRLWCLISEDAEGEGPQGAADAGVEWIAIRGASRFLARLDEVGGGDLVLLSFGVPGVDPAVVERIVDGLPRMAGPILSAPGASLDLALAARRLGAGSLLREPLDRAEVRREVRRRFPVDDGVPLPERSEGPGGVRMVGSGPWMARVVRAIAEVADTTTSVLLTGESGTGKELVARALHESSRRSTGPFVAINCAAIPEHLLESEFFGHERGAFTGAVARKEGRFERADGGTLFLDEVGDMSPILQAKILRALEEGEVERVGGGGPVPVDVRIVAATNRNLEERVEEGSFREDLMFRLAAARIWLPPLRDRLEDLEELVLHFAAEFANRYGRPMQGVDREAFRLLRTHQWPGNIRELRNVVDRAVRGCQGGWIRPEDIVLGMKSPRMSPRERGAADGYEPTRSLEEVERDHIRRVLDYTDGVMGEAAEILGIHRNTLTRKVDRYELRSHLAQD